MNFGNCKCCSAMIKYTKIPVCEKCLDNYYRIVRQYIYENGISSIQDLHEATNVPLKVIEYFVENGSLYDENEKDVEQNIELMEKRRTINALRELRNSMKQNNSVVEDKKIDNGSGMRFINH